MGASARKLKIQHVSSELAAEAHAFHSANVGSYLWPRDQGYFAKLVDEQQLWCLTEDGRCVGICYVRSDDAALELEFGGVSLADTVRGHGLADPLGLVAIAAEFARNAPLAAAKLIAHVHVENNRPRKLLARLGFVYAETEPVPMHVQPQPANMPRNANGEIVGDVFHFDFAKCASFAADLEVGFSSEAFEITLSSPLFTDELALTCKALRAIADGYRAAPSNNT